MANISEEPLAAGTASALEGSVQEGLSLLGLTDADEPAAVIEALDAFVYDWQKGKRPPTDQLDPEDAPFALGSVWGRQLVRRFGWEWAVVTFHDHDDSTAPGVLSPDRSLAVYPIHFLLGALEDAGVDATIALSYNMLDAGSVKGLKPRGYFNLMDGVHRIVPRI